MNEDDFLDSSRYVVRIDKGHDSDEGKTLITDSSGPILSDSCIRASRDSIFHVPHERSALIQSQQKVPLTEILHIPEDRREEFLDHVKEEALRGMIEQADLINAVSYEERTDHITGDKIIIAKLRVIIEE